MHRLGSRSLAISALAALAALSFASCQPAPETAGEPPPVDTTAIVVEAGAVFSWAHDPRAELYRVELFDPAGRILGGAVTRDTTVPADLVVPDTARAGTWRVIAVSGGGTELPPSARQGFRRR